MKLENSPNLQNLIIQDKPWYESYLSLPKWLVKEVISDLMSVDVVTRGTMEGWWVVDGCQHSGSSLPFAVLHSFSFCFSNFLKNHMNEFV